MWFFLIPIIGIFLIILLFNFYFFKFQKEYNTDSSVSRERLITREVDMVAENLKEEIATFSAKPVTNFNPACFQVPIYNSSPWIGAYQTQTKNGIGEFYYVGKIIKVEEKQINDCIYNTIFLDRDGTYYELNIPQGITSNAQSGILPGISPQILGYHPGKTVQLKIDYKFPKKDVSSGDKFDTLYFLQWEVYLFRVD